MAKPLNLLQAIRKDLKGASYAKCTAIGKLTGVHPQSVWRIASGYTRNPSYTLVWKLSRYRSWKTN